MTTDVEPRPSPTGCCAVFDPRPWQDQHVRWDHKLFLKDRVRCAAWIPLNMDERMAADMELVRAAGAEPEQGLMLADMTSPFGMDLYIDVAGPVPGAEMAELSGSFFTHVFDGPSSETRDWMNQLAAMVARRRLHAERIYFAYTTCPSCAEKLGHNYVVGFAKLREARPWAPSEIAGHA